MGRHGWGGMSWKALYPRRESVRVGGIVLLAFAVRLVYNLTAASPYKPTFDAALYDHIARNLLNRHCFCLFGSHLTVSRAPLWPWIISLIYSLAGQHDFYARLFLCVLGSGTCLIVYRFARDLFGQRAAAVAGVIAATYTGLFLYDGWLYTESLYTFCVTAFAYALYRLQPTTTTDGPPVDGAARGVWRGISQAVARRRWAILCGLCAAAASLTRPNGMILLGIVMVWAAILIWVYRRPGREIIQNALLSIGIAMVLVAPWTYRNYTVAHAFIPIETGLGEVLIGAYDNTVAFGPTGVRGYWRPPPGTINHDNLRYTPETDRQYTTRALQWMASHPADLVHLWSFHLINMWWPYTYAHGLAIEQAPNRLSSYVVWALIFLESIPVFALAAVALVTTRHRHHQALLPIYLLLAVTVLQNMVFYSTMRFRAPIEPLLVVLVSGLVVTGIPRRRPAEVSAHASAVGVRAR